MSDIPEGLVEVVARALCLEEDGNPDDAMIEAQGRSRWEGWVSPARAAILAQNAWQDDLNRRMVEFVEFRGKNPRG